MKADSPRWAEVTPSCWPHEKEGLDYVRDNLPDSTPYRAWSNFEFASHPIETALIEKFSKAVALGSANTRVRDYADVYTLAGNRQVTGSSPVGGANKQVRDVKASAGKGPVLSKFDYLFGRR